MQPEDESEDDEATRFFAKQVETPAIVPVPATPDVDRKAPVETGVPADPKEVEFKRAGQETSAARKLKSEQEAAKEAEETLNRRRVPGAEDAAAAAVIGKAAKDKDAASAKKKPSMAVLAGVAGAIVLVAGVSAMALRGGGAEPEAAPTQTLAEATAGTIDLGADATANATDLNALGVAAEDPTVADAAQASDDADATAAMRREAARATAAEARLKALEKSNAKALKARAKTSTDSKAAAKAGRKEPAEASTASADDGAVSAAQLSQFYSVVDEARGMAKKVMRSGNPANAAMAKNYDSNLKTLRASMRGIKSEKEADRLIKQAILTRSYVKFLANQ
jgi:hypothetical protein